VCASSSEDIELILSKRPVNRISWEDFDVICTLKRSIFGEVVLAKLKNGSFCFKKGRKLVIKKLKKTDVNQQKLSENIMITNYASQEFGQGQKCHFIANLQYVFCDEEYCFIASEWAPGGTVADFLKHGTDKANFFMGVKQTAIRFILGCIVLALEYLHKKQIFYQDLKPEKLLVYEDGYVKLADFGLCTKMREG
jgi:serine/threonine protein kinase